MNPTLGLAINATNINHTITGDYNITSSAVGRPIVQLSSTGNFPTAPSLRLSNLRDGNGLEDNDKLGDVKFNGADAAGNAQDYGQIASTVVTAADGDEAGKLELTTAASDSTTSNLRNFITGTGHGTNDTVNVSIGYGTLSQTTVAGNFRAYGADHTFASSDDNDPTIRIENDNTNANGARLYLAKAQDGAANDVLGNIIFEGKNADGDEQNFASIVGSIVDATGGGEEGKLVLNVASHDAETCLLYTSPSPRDS